MRILRMTFAALLLAALVAGCSDDSTSPNQPPNAPDDPTPSDAAVGQPRDVTLTWKAGSDPDGGTTTYDVYLGFAGIMPKVASGITTNSYTHDEALEYDRPYTWRVVAIDAQGARTSSAEWKFTVLPCPETTGLICTWAGTGYAMWDGGDNPLMESGFYWPMDVVFTPSLGTFVVDYNNHRIRRLSAQQTLETVIGTDIIGDGPEDRSDETLPGAIGTECRLNHPTRLIEREHGPDAGTILLTSWHNHKLRRWDPNTNRVFITIGRGGAFEGDGQDATQFGRLNQPQHAIEASDGSVLILDQRNQVIRKVDPSNVISTVAGLRVLDGSDAVGGYNGDGLAPLATRFNFESGGNPQPSGAILLDDLGNLFVADVLNHVVRKIDWNANTVTIVAGQGQSPGYTGDGGQATTNAQLNGPMDMEWGPDGRLYLAEKYNHVVRAIDLSSGVIETVVGTGTPGFAGDGGVATAALLDAPHGIAFDSAGDLYVVDTNNHRIRKVFMP